MPAPFDAAIWRLRSRRARHSPSHRRWQPPAPAQDPGRGPATSDGPSGRPARSMTLVRPLALLDRHSITRIVTLLHQPTNRTITSPHGIAHFGLGFALGSPCASTLHAFVSPHVSQLREGRVPSGLLAVPHGLFVGFLALFMARPARADSRARGASWDAGAGEGRPTPSSSGRKNARRRLSPAPSVAVRASPRHHPRRGGRAHLHRRRQGLPHQPVLRPDADAHAARHTRAALRAANGAHGAPRRRVGSAARRDEHARGRHQRHSHIDLIETGRYESQLAGGLCTADVKRSRSFDLGGARYTRRARHHPRRTAVAPKPKPEPPPAPDPGRCALSRRAGRGSKRALPGRFLRTRRELHSFGRSCSTRAGCGDPHGDDLDDGTTGRRRPMPSAWTRRGRVTVASDARRGFVRSGRGYGGRQEHARDGRRRRLASGDTTRSSQQLGPERRGRERGSRRSWCSRLVPDRRHRCAIAEDGSTHTEVYLPRRSSRRWLTVALGARGHPCVASEHARPRLLEERGPGPVCREGRGGGGAAAREGQTARGGHARA